jgi:DNA-binding GntR family transcriptional regulator
VDPLPDLDALRPLAPRRSAADNAYETLREAVISLALPPGTVIARAAVAARLGVSQTPVREALIRLQQEDLIEVVPHSATRVTRIDIASAREAGFLRLAIEVEIVRRLADRPPQGLAARLGAELRRMRDLVDLDDPAGLAAADEAFHAALYDAAAVPGLRVLVRSRSGHLDRLRRLHLPAPTKARAILRDHEALAEAILDGKPNRAERQLREHLSGTLAEAETLRAGAPQFF